MGVSTPRGWRDPLNQYKYLKSNIENKKCKKITKAHTKAKSDQKEKETHCKTSKSEDFNEENLKMTQHKSEIELSGCAGNESQTELALKDPESFFIYTHYVGGDLVEDGTVVYSDECTLEEEEEYLNEIIYVRDFDSYLMLGSHHLYCKQIDDEPSTPVMDFSPPIGHMSCLRYADLSQKLVLSDSGGDLFFICLYRMVVEFKAKRTIKEAKEGHVAINRFKLFGKKNKTKWFP